MDARKRFFSQNDDVNLGVSMSDRFDAYLPRPRASSQGSKTMPSRPPMSPNPGRKPVATTSQSNTRVGVHKALPTAPQTKNGKPLYVGDAPAMSDSKYNMTHKSKGRVVIFVHEHFDELEQREGADADEKNLKACLPILGITEDEITVYYDLTLSEITEQLTKISSENYEDRDCLMVFVLTHGERDDKIYAKDTDYTVDKIWKPFIGERCMDLTGKPKIFCIVACRGNKTDSGITVTRRRKHSTATDAIPQVASQTFSIPINADMLTIFSTVQGYFSYREPDRGTWFVESFKRELNRLAETETQINITQLLESVNRRMAQAYMTYDPSNKDMHQMKQCASYTSTLTRTMYLTLDRNKIK